MTHEEAEGMARRISEAVNPSVLRVVRCESSWVVLVEDVKEGFTFLIAAPVGADVIIKSYGN